MGCLVMFDASLTASLQHLAEAHPEASCVSFPEIPAAVVVPVCFQMPLSVSFLLQLPVRAALLRLLPRAQVEVRVKAQSELDAEVEVPALCHAPKLSARGPYLPEVPVPCA